MRMIGSTMISSDSIVPGSREVLSGSSRRLRRSPKRLGEVARCLGRRTVMPTRGFVQGYTAQAVTTEEQLIVAAEVITGGNERRPRRCRLLERRAFAQIKNNLRAGRFSRRGLASCRAEWHLIAATHNLLKLYRSGLAPAGA